MASMITCWANRIKPPGGAPKSRRVADCESGMGRHNMYQFMPRSKFPALAAEYMQGIPGSRDIDNPRANTIVALKIARKEGWGQWPTCGKR